MHIRSLLGRLASESRCWIPGAERRGSWYFLPVVELDATRDMVYHSDEPVRERGSVVMVAEHLHRRIDGGGAVRTYVRGRVDQVDQPLLYLRRWHLALRVDGPVAAPLAASFFGNN